MRSRGRVEPIIYSVPSIVCDRVAGSAKGDAYLSGIELRVGTLEVDAHIAIGVDTTDYDIVSVRERAIEVNIDRTDMIVR